MRTDHDIDDPIAWGRRLIETEDHDPVYTMLASAFEQQVISMNYLLRFHIAYWCLYHCGAASWIAKFSGWDFWLYLMIAAQNQAAVSPALIGAADEKRWPRAHERRHWRGQKAIDCVGTLKVLYGDDPEAMVRYIFTGNMWGSNSNPQDLDDVIRRVREHPQFGPWIGFKIADMGERLLGATVHFPTDVWRLYRDPLRGAEMAAKVRYRDPQNGPQTVVHDMLTGYYDMMAPPYRDRRVNIQEVETVLCKWKSARNGHYYIGKDIYDIRAGMQAWGPLAQELSTHLPSDVPSVEPSTPVLSPV